VIFTLNAEIRKTVKKSDLTNLRNSGMIPIVIYGNEFEPVSLSINKAEFTAAYKKSFGEVTFYEINVAGVKHQTMLKAKQTHPLTRDILHIDFMVLGRNSKVDIDVPLHFIGEPIGVQFGGTVDVIQRTVKVSCMVNQLPEDIKVEISQMEAGTSLHVSDLPQGAWEYKDALDNAILVVHSPKGESEPVAEDSEAEEPVAE